MKRVLILLMILFSGTVFAQSPQLKFNRNGTFKIVQFTDLHLQKSAKSDIAYERIKKVLKEEKPDFVVFTGDIVYGEPAKEILLSAFKPVINRKIPYAFVFGNHDDEHGVSRRQLYEIAQSQPYCVNAKIADRENPFDFVLPVYFSDNSKISSLLYFIDSHAYSKISGVKGYDYIYRNQIEWYAAESKAATQKNGGVPYPALAFFHIPLPEYSEAIEDQLAQMYGTRREPVCAPKLNSGFFTAVKECGDIFAMFCGHDHNNDYAVAWYNVLLAYGRYSGGDTEYNDLPNGARVIELYENQRKLKTWIRTQSGVEQITVFPDTYKRRND